MFRPWPSVFVFKIREDLISPTQGVTVANHPLPNAVDSRTDPRSRSACLYATGLLYFKEVFPGGELLDSCITAMRTAADLHFHVLASARAIYRFRNTLV